MSNVLMREPGIITRGNDVYLSWAGTRDKFGCHEIYVGFSDGGGDEFACAALASFVDQTESNEPVNTDIILDVNGRATVLWREDVDGDVYELLVSHVLN